MRAYWEVPMGGWLVPMLPTRKQTKVRDSALQLMSSNRSSERKTLKKPQFIVFADFRGAHTPAMADFELCTRSP